MSRNGIIGTVGILIALIPSLGFPQSFESTILVIAGISILVLSIVSHREKRIKEIFSREFFDHLRHRSPAFKEGGVDIQKAHETERSKI